MQLLVQIVLALVFHLSHWWKTQLLSPQHYPDALMAPPAPCSVPGLVHGLHYRSLCRAQCLRQLQWPPSSLWQTQEPINYFCSMLPSLQLLSSPTTSRRWVRSCPLQVFCDDIWQHFCIFHSSKTAKSTSCLTRTAGLKRHHPLLFPSPDQTSSGLGLGWAK